MVGQIRHSNTQTVSHPIGPIVSLLRLQPTPARSVCLLSSASKECRNRCRNECVQKSSTKRVSYLRVTHSTGSKTTVLRAQKIVPRKLFPDMGLRASQCIKRWGVHQSDAFFTWLVAMLSVYSYGTRSRFINIKEEVIRSKEL